jgi:hypothetical protein
MQLGGFDGSRGADPVSALPRSTAASSKTCWRTWRRHAQPVTLISASPALSTAKNRPASAVLFHALNWLIKSNPDHGTRTAGSACLAVSARS